MAETHHKSETSSPTTRCYNLVYVSDAKYQSIPAVSVKGHWLEEMGFGTGTPWNIRVMQYCLIITRQEPQPEVVTTLKRACGKLSDRKEREIAAFIELVVTPQKRPREISEGTGEWRSVYDNSLVIN
ncbi:SymE family type I addiction module toxin [Erwinia billingiae]|uniref:SymE family type I addiction module toxin n=1 Tax=Erwinia billingiae TaxID=182337 RepID=UPI0008DD868D|nr:SymE family type I addiction module toxin [Erwinia billingiae]